ncbi:asparagine synthetase B [Cellulomonas chitinilytica]|uniref:asparagine synthase (glutamine-hydrolyzing) n=1 Tax=Cellulomonas chitinilytica TaxID=398759 RepID=A0A919U1Y8_9CELL|nr:asparagine synthetase B [Cellulomonas chitinilytica]GIG20604.1 asparagine synthetase B [Cellulomonas chitinilytica]
MCGIVAAVGGGSDAVRAGLVGAGLRRIEHRGSPGTRHEDAHAVTAAAHLGTNRLPIVGGPAGRQPVTSRSGATVVVHNGEVYNFRELAAELGLPAAAATSDTAVLAELVEARGVRAALRAVHWEGVLVAADERTGTVVAARDHLGIKPLYLVRAGEVTVLASEIKALLDVPGAERITEVPPGALVTFAPSSAEPVADTWWDAADVVRARPSDVRPGAALDDVARTVRDAVHARVPDEPYAVMLSGGLDSSLVLAHALERSRDVTAFVLYREGSPDVDVARRLCDDLDVELVEVVGHDPHELWEHAGQVVGIVESWEWHVVNHAAPMLRLVDAVAASGRRVVLTGEGADELFFGYTERGADGAVLTDPDALERRRVDRLRALHRTNCQRLDRMSMHRTLECRVPFLDVAVVEAALRHPAPAHLEGGRTKSLLRDAARRVLPAYVTDRDKLSLAKGAGYVYDAVRGGGVFHVPDQGVRDAVDAAVETFPYRFPVERALVDHFVRHGYDRAAFMREATV